MQEELENMVYSGSCL